MIVGYKFCVFNYNKTLSETMNELITSIVQKVKDALKIQDDLSSTELYDRLHKYWITQHPDKFIDAGSKKDAEEKFKDLNILLKEFAKYIEEEQQQRNPSEVVLYQKDYESVRFKQQLINLEEQIRQLLESNTEKDREIESFKRQILALQGDKVDEKTSKLINDYKPSTKNLVSQGVALLCTVIIGILTKIEQVAVILAKYFPFNPIYLNYIVFGVIVFIPLRFFKMYIEEYKIGNTAKRIQTPLFINRFLQYLTQKEVNGSFTELNVYEFLNLELVAPKGIKRILQVNIFNLYTETTIASLKDIFIFNLLNKERITVSDAEDLDRKFKIVKKSSYFPF